MYLLTTATVLLGCLFLRQANGCLSGDPSNNPSATTGTTTPTTAAQTTQALTTTPLTTSSAAATTSVAASTTASGPDYVAACKALGADFGNSDNGGYTPQTFAPNTKLLNNKDTGIPKPNDGKKSYMGAQLKAKDPPAILTSSPVSGMDGKNMIIKYYEATDQMVLKACSNDMTNCAPISNLGIKATDLKWQTGNYQVPAGTTKVLLVCENDNGNIGACGVDQIGISDAQGGTDHCKGSSASGA